jgi:hypothetical protein
MKFSPFHCYIIPLKPEYSPQHPILKHRRKSSTLHIHSQLAVALQLTLYASNIPSAVCARLLRLSK